MIQQRKSKPLTWLASGSAVLLLAAAASVAFAQTARADRQKPNVLFIIADDLRNSFGAYGDRTAHSPNLDQLAKRGVRFDRAYVQYPVCNPSRTSFLTGLRPETTGVLDNATFFRRRLPDVVTLPQLFKQQGYFTASLGKIFHRGGTMEEVNEDWADPASWSHVRFYQSTARGKQGEGRNLTGGALKWCHWLAAEGGHEDQPDGQGAAEAVRLINEKRNEPFFIGDHGYHLGERGWWNKNTLFELSTRAPLLVYAPRAKGNGKASRALVEFVDLYPTLVELAGLAVPRKLEGESFKPLLDDPARKGKHAAFTVVTRGKTLGRTVRTDRWRYTEWDGGQRGVELYDHQKAAGEYRNLARDAQHAATVAEMKKLLSP